MKDPIPVRVEMDMLWIIMERPALLVVEEDPWILMEVSRPQWPTHYPQANFICKWTINMSANSSIQFTVNSSAYGINGRLPCSNDHIAFFDGLERECRSLGKFCKLDVPPPITTSTGAVRVVFEGRLNPSRPASNKGIRVIYSVTD